MTDAADTGASAEGAAALTTIINALKDLKPEERRRILRAAMVFYGESAKPSPEHEMEADDDGTYPTGVAKWMKQYGVSANELDQALHFNNGSYEVLQVPGASKKDRTLNAYILTGLGKFLTTGERGIDDATARALCETVACYDQANHSVTLKSTHPEFSGDKKKGYLLTNPGVKRGAELVKQIAGAAG